MNSNEYVNYADLILGGTMLAVDPSSGSKKSKAGFAYFDQGILVTSGVADIDHNKTIYNRLIDTYDFFAASFCQPDILVIEKISGYKVHRYLYLAVGTIIPAVRASFTVEMNTSTWKRLNLMPGYVKGDRQDALQIGYAAIELAGGE